MINWCLFLHLYQPPNQDLTVLDKIVRESYKPLVHDLLAHSRAKLTININACTTELLWKNGHKDIVEGLRTLCDRGQVEFTGSAKFHPFLPILPTKEITAQILENEKTNKKYLGPKFITRGFFPPEMGYSKKVGEVVSNLGYKWLLIDEISCGGKIGQVKFDRLYFDQNLRNKLYFYFRERESSDLLVSAVLRDPKRLANYLLQVRNPFILMGMDGETFGHHRPGLEDTLKAIYEDPRINFLTLSEVFDLIDRKEAIEVVESTWATSEKEISKGKNFYLYFNSENKLHVAQKKLMDLAIKVCYEANTKYALNKLHFSLSCNHMWWGNPDSWWSIEEIEKGAYTLLETIKSVLRTKHLRSKRAYLDLANNYYSKILEIAFAWQRSGLVKKLHQQKEEYKKIPFKDRANLGEYEALLEILQEEERKAVENLEYELALRWRDARIKLEKGNDIYDFIHIVDQLRIEEKLNKYEFLTEKYKKMLKNNI